MYDRKDSYYKKAKAEGYKSRAAYKLKEINQKYKLFKKGSAILDLGAAPGGWTQVVLETIGDKGKIVAVDLVNITGIDAPNYQFIQGDMTDPEVILTVRDCYTHGYDLVLSDMAPKTTGIKLKDHVGSVELVTIAFKLSLILLKNGGSFLVKLFDGEDRETLIKQFREHFTSVKIIRPDATRKASFEMYIVCTGYKKL